MVMEYGMSDLGPMNFGPDSDVTDYRRVWSENNISPDMQYKIDQEIQKILKTAYNEAIKVLQKNKKLLDEVSISLLKKENMSKEEFEEIVGKKENKNALETGEYKKSSTGKKEKTE
jgi:cell division protease FtsH